MTEITARAREYVGGLAHVHTKLSNYPGHFESDQTVGSIVEQFRAAGLLGGKPAPLQYIMITEHASNPVQPKRLGRLSLRARALHRSHWTTHREGVPVLHGFEASLLPGGGTDLTPWLGAHSSLVIASVHGLPETLPDGAGAHAALLKQACANPDIDVLGHPQRGLERQAGSDWPGLFGAAAASGTAIEVNLNIFPAQVTEPERYSFWTGWLRQLAASGAPVFIGSDVHNHLQIQRFIKAWQGLGDESRPNALRDCVLALEAAGIGPERVVNATFAGFTAWLNLPKPDRRR